MELKGIMDARKEDYIQALDSFDRQCEKLKKSGVTRTGALMFSVKPEDTIELFKAVGDVIHHANILAETAIGNNCSGHARSFFSAIRFLDNLMKHSTQDIKAWDIIGEASKIESRGKWINGQLAIGANIEKIAVWRDIPSSINVDSRNQNQKNNYDLLLRDQAVIETIEKLDGYIKSYINFD